MGRAAESDPAPPASKVLRAAEWAMCLLAAGAALAAVWAVPRIIGDLYVALAAGRDILAGKLGRPDEWSFLTADRVWINQNWLTHLLCYGCYLAGGEIGLLVLKAIMILATWAALAFVARRQRLGGPAAILVAAGVIAAARSFIDLRPNLTTLMMAAVLLWTLYLTRRRTHLIWVSAGLVGLWANMHGGFLFGLGMLGLWALVRTVAAIRSGLRAAVRQCWPFLGAVAAAVLLAGLANPFGTDNLVHPFVVGGSRVWRSVAEWRSVFDAASTFGTLWEFWAVVGLVVGLVAIRLVLGTVRGRGRDRNDRLRLAIVALLLAGAVFLATCLAELPEDSRQSRAIREAFALRRGTVLLIFGPLTALACLAALTAAVALVKRKAALDLDRFSVTFFEAVVAAVAVAMALRARRFIPLAVIVLAPVVAGQLGWVFRRPAGRWATIVAAAALLVPVGLLARQDLRHYSPDNPRTLPESFFQRMHNYHRSFAPGVAAFLNANALAGRVYQYWGWEGLLRWRCPRLKVFVGGRAQQIYTESMFRQQDRIANGRGSAAILADLGVRLAVVPLAGSDKFFDATVFAPRPRWAFVYCDGFGVVLADTQRPENGELIRRAKAGRLCYPDEAAAALSRAFCLMSVASGAGQAEALAAIQQANRLRPIPQSYLSLGSVLRPGRADAERLAGYLAAEGERLAAMDHHVPGGLFLLESRMVIATVLAGYYQSVGRREDAQRQRAIAEAVEAEIKRVRARYP